MRKLLAMRLLRVRSDEHLRDFAEGFCTVIARRTDGVVRGHVPLDYLRRSQVVGAFDDQGRMVAGYVIGTEEPLRLLEFVPEPARLTLQPPPGASWADCCEISCLWRRPEVSPIYMSARVWPQAILNAVGSGKRYVLGGNQSARLDAIYSKAGGGVTLYAGPSSANLPSRLFAYPSDRLIRTAMRVIAGETVRRVRQKGRR